MSRLEGLWTLYTNKRDWLVCARQAGDRGKGLPHRRDYVGLGQLHQDGAATKLVTSVARVPVVLSGVPVQEGIATPTHPLHHRGTC